MQQTRFYFNKQNNMLLDVEVGVFKYDADARAMVLVERLRRREQRVLACLLAQCRTLVTREYILFHAWQGRIVSDNSLSVTICQLRKTLMKLDPDCRCLETVRNIGFAFLPEKSELMPVESLAFLLASLHWCTLARMPKALAMSDGTTERGHHYTNALRLQ